MRQVATGRRLRPDDSWVGAPAKGVWASLQCCVGKGLVWIEPTHPVALLTREMRIRRTACKHGAHRAALLSSEMWPGFTLCSPHGQDLENTSPYTVVDPALGLAHQVATNLHRPACFNPLAEAWVQDEDCQRVGEVNPYRSWRGGPVFSPPFSRACDLALRAWLDDVAERHGYPKRLSCSRNSGPAPPSSASASSIAARSSASRCEGNFTAGRSSSARTVTTVPSGSATPSRITFPSFTVPTATVMAGW